MPAPTRSLEGWFCAAKPEALGGGKKELTSPSFLVIVKRFRKNASIRVFYGGSVRAARPVLGWQGLKPRAGSSEAGQTGPRIGSLLAEGRGKSHRCSRVLHLGGLCEPEPAKRSGPFQGTQGKRPATVPALVWKWNEGRREAATTGLPCVCAPEMGAIAGEAPEFCALHMNEVAGF